VVPIEPVEHTQPPSSQAAYATDFQEVKGQEHVKRALEVAAAGGHNVLMIGPPGAGKTLLARALPTILPTMSVDEALDVTRVYSVADLLPGDVPLIQHRPFRSPHHTISHAGLVGGGTWPRPGEISLAHRGVLFLDEMPEFGPRVLEVLRQPLEDKVVTISRARGSSAFPANFMLVGAMNPWACGAQSGFSADIGADLAQLTIVVARTFPEWRVAAWPARSRTADLASPPQQPTGWLIARTLIDRYSST
jgi:magnesium chelatase family protein